jgi:hypothetical protein
VEEQKRILAERAQMRAAERFLSRDQKTNSPSKQAFSPKTLTNTSNNNTPRFKPISAASSSSNLQHPPKLIHPVQKPLSNRQLIKNALIHVCLAGTVHDRIKQEVLEDLEVSPASHFIILLRGSKNHAFRGLYSYDPTLNQVLKIYASPATIDEQTGQVHVAAPYSGPDSLEAGDVIEFFKYDSGTRSFKTLPTTHFGMSVCAVAIHSDFGRKVIQKAEHHLKYGL